MNDRSHRQIQIHGKAIDELHTYIYTYIHLHTYIYKLTRDMFAECTIRSVSKSKKKTPQPI